MSLENGYHLPSRECWQESVTLLELSRRILAASVDFDDITRTRIQQSHTELVLAITLKCDCFDAFGIVPTEDFSIGPRKSSRDVNRYSPRPKNFPISN